MNTKRKAFERWQRFGQYRCNHTDKLLVALEDLAWKAGWTACARVMRHEMLDDRQSIIKGMEAMADSSARLRRKAKKGRK